MRLRLVAVVLVVAAMLAVPTVAMTTNESGQDGIDGSVELAPHDGPNGEYATVQDDELRIDFERLNDEAETTAHDVFTVTSTADEPVEVWVAADANGSVTPYEGDDPDAELGEGEWRGLQPGETLPVGFSIDTYGETPDSGTVTVGVRNPDDGSSEGESGTPDDGTGGDDPGDGGASNATPTPATSEPDVRNPTAGVEIVFDGEGDFGNVTVRELDSLPTDGPSTAPRAAIDPGRLRSGIENDGLSVHGTEFVAQQHEPVRLTGTQSYVSTADSVVQEPRPAAIVDITPPPELRDSPALIRMRVARDGFPGTDPADARIGRHTPDGWQLIPTRVVEETDETVLLEARTQGFSVFTVFAESGVDYEWTLPDGRTVPSDELRTSFVDAGHREVTLTVTDAFGRSDDATQEILVNDPPTVAIRQSPNGTDGESTTLRADVTNEYGNATVTWTLPDGSTATGAIVTGEFTEGETVGVTVEDEYGATGTAETTVGGGPGQSGVRHLPLSLPLWAWALLAVAAVTLAVALARSGLLGRVGAGAGVLGRAVLAAVGDDSPRITRFEAPRWNPAADRIEIAGLEVVAPSGTLSAVELSVTDADGTPVVTRTVELGATGTYSASPEYVPVYGGLELSDDARYSIRVRAVDDRDRVGVADRTPSGVFGAGA